MAGLNLFERLDEGDGGNSPSGSVRFHEATALTGADVEALQKTARRRVLRWFHRHGLLEEHSAREMLAWAHAGGFSLDASIRIQAHDRAGLERLLPVLRPATAGAGAARVGAQEGRG